MYAKIKMESLIENCCRICLEVSDTMLSTDEQLDKFNKTISELIIECINLEVSKSTIYPKLICKECFSVLLVVADFHEKCKHTEKTLERWRSKTQQLDKPSAGDYNFQEADEEEEVEMQQIDENEEEEGETEVTEIVADEHLVGNTDSYVDTISDTETDKRLYVKNEPDYENIEYVQEIENGEPVEYVFIQKKENDLEDLYVQVNSDDAFVVEEHEFNDETVVENEISENSDEQVVNINNEKVVILQKPKQELNKTDKNSPKKSLSASQKSTRKSERREYKQTVINYKCKVCGAGFTHLNNLVKHHQTHNANHLDSLNLTDIDEQSAVQNENSVETTSVSETVSRTSAKKRLNTEKKKLDKEYNCEYCKKAFSSPSLLLVHVRIHTGERPFKCKTCPKAFKTQGALDLHARRHSGHKPYKCTVCNRGFAESSNLKVHMRTHTGEKPHTCTTCNRSFSRVFLLQLHQRTHTGERPYLCDVCEKSFAQQCDLTAHRRIHTGERPHVCHVCSKGFIKGSALTQHMRRHTQPKHKKLNLLNTTKQEIIETETSENIDDEQIIFCLEPTDSLKEYFKEEATSVS